MPVAQNIKHLKKQIAEKANELKTLKNQLSAEKSRLKFKCACGAYHAIRDCDVVQEYWYMEPYGCSGGDYWNEGELQAVCPKTGVRNRILSFQKKDFEEKFSREFKHLFKSVIKDYKELKTPWCNNDYFEKNAEKWGIE